MCQEVIHQNLRKTYSNSDREQELGECNILIEPMKTEVQRGCPQSKGKLRSRTKQHLVQSVQELSQSPAASVEDPASLLEKGEDPMMESN